MNHIDISTHTDKLIKGLDIISVSILANTKTDLIIPTSLINTGQTFKSHPNNQAEGRRIAVSSVCLQTRQFLVNLELKEDQNYSSNTNEGYNRRSYTLHKYTGCNKTGFISMPINSNKLKHTLRVILCSNSMCTLLMTALTTCPISKVRTAL